MPWLTQGVITNPATGQVLADTGSVPDHRCTVEIFCWANIGMEMLIEYLDSDGTVLASQVVPVTLSWLRIPFLTRFRFASNQRLRVTAREAAVGQCQASILHT